MDISVIIGKLKQYPIPVVCTILSILFLVLALMRGGSIPEKDMEFTSLEEQMEKISKNKGRATDIQRQMDALLAAEGKIEERLMVHESKALNQGYFYQLEERTGIKIRSILQEDKKPLPKTVEKGEVKLSLYNPVTFKLGIEGEFSDVLDFMYQLRYGKYFTRIDSFSCRHNSANKGAPLTVSFDIQVLGNL